MYFTSDYLKCCCFTSTIQALFDFNLNVLNINLLICLKNFTNQQAKTLLISNPEAHSVYSMVTGISSAEYFNYFIDNQWLCCTKLIQFSILNAYYFLLYIILDL
jgi:hypothetical protein